MYVLNNICFQIAGQKIVFAMRTFISVAKKDVKQEAQ